jgi:diaminohydroxyphosphoribosylaminopyrimidine deaminase/5-amino-6-(5-phosphoribosylamino)uracil reductase
MERALCGAVMVGAETAQLDDPQLTVRLPGLEDRTQLRVVMVGSRPFDPRISLIADVSPLPTAIIVPEGREIAVPPTVDVIEVPAREGRPDLGAALKALSARGVGRLLVEGGAVLCEALLAADLVDRFHLVTSPRVIGPHGVPATILGGLDGRILAAGLVEVDRRDLGEDKLRTFERA